MKLQDNSSELVLHSLEIQNLKMTNNRMLLDTTLENVNLIWFKDAETFTSLSIILMTAEKSCHSMTFPSNLLNTFLKLHSAKWRLIIFDTFMNVVMVITVSSSRIQDQLENLAINNTCLIERVKRFQVYTFNKIYLKTISSVNLVMLISMPDRKIKKREKSLPKTLKIELTWSSFNSSSMKCITNMRKQSKVYLIKISNQLVISKKKASMKMLLQCSTQYSWVL